MKIKWTVISVTTERASDEEVKSLNLRKEAK